MRAELAGQIGELSLQVSLEARPGEVTALFGPSGAGKTTILRAIAGLERLGGEVSAGGEVWQDAHRFLPPHRRAVGFVLQEPALFPHLDVTGNLRYGARRAQGEAGLSFDQTVELLGLGPLLGRATQKLSGGEKQRVAIGRALLSRPRLLLMDEPLSALDHEARASLLDHLDRLRQSLAIPVIHVTHDREEVLRLAGKVILMRGGRVESEGNPHELLRTRPGRAEDGHSPLSVITARILRHDPRSGASRIAVGGQETEVPLLGAETGARVRLSVGARDVQVFATVAEGMLAATILRSESTEGSFFARLHLLCDETHMIARIPRKLCDTSGFQKGSTVGMLIVEVHYLEVTTGES